MQTPIQVAKKANVSVQSVRNWTRDYADLLSPEARGEMGARLFNDADVEVICTIASLRRSGVPPGEVAERIQNQDVPPVVDVASEAPQSPPQQPTETPQTAPDAQIALYAAHTTLQSRVEGIERRLDAQAAESRSRQHLAITMVVLGVLLGWVIVMVLQLGLNALQG
jgi:DNA-binding transcriptional MerR regulator